MAKIKRSEDRNYTPEPGRLDADIGDETGPVPTLSPDEVSDEDLTLEDDLDVGPEEPPPDLNEEQQDYSEEVQDHDD